MLLNLVALAAFAEGYHVCVASYQKLANAEEIVKDLENQSIAAFINENKVNNQTLYRVLLSKEFKKIEDARKYRDEVAKYSFAKELKLKDFWVCKGDKSLAIKSEQPAPAVKPAPKQKAAPAPAKKTTPKATKPKTKKTTPKPQPQKETPKKAEPKPVEEPKVIEPPVKEPEPPVKNIEPPVVKEEPAPLPEPEPIQEPPAKEEPAPLPEPEPLPEPPAQEEPAPLPEPEPEPLPPPEPAKNEVAEKPPVIVEEPKSLDKNEKAVLSELTPYSVLVRSYKYSQFAENDSNRLKELGFDSYLLNTFDDTDFFAFNIHAGAFKSREEAEALQNQFTDAGIFETQVSDYNEIKPKIEKYDEIITNQRVTFDDGRTDFPTSLTPAIEKLVKQFPANKDFQIKEISILDYDNYLSCADKPDVDSAILKEIAHESSVYAALLATYRDELYQKEVSVFLVNAEDFKFNNGEQMPFESAKLSGNPGVFDSSVYGNDNKLTLCGSNATEKLFVRMKTNDFTREEFMSFLNESFGDASLSLYPQMRRTFCTLPDQIYTGDRKIISFNFKNVGSDYASERKNIEWARPIVGHSLAKSYFSDAGNLYCIGLYDLDYDFNAMEVHSHFMNDKNNMEPSDSNQPILVNGARGWYLVNTTQKEISFSTQSYVVAVDTEPESPLTQDDLVRIGCEMKIWNGMSAVSSDAPPAEVETSLPLDEPASIDAK